MGKNDQIINYLSVSALEELGIHEPTQQQLDCLEAGLSESFQWISLAVFILARLGDASPSAATVKRVSQGLFELMWKYSKGEGASDEA